MARLLVSASLVSLLLLVPLASAIYTADLDAENQLPPIQDFPGFGSCTTYPINDTTWGYNLTVVDIPDLTLAHFHEGGPQTSGPVVIPLLELPLPITIEGEAIISSTFTTDQFVGPLAGQSFAGLITRLDHNLIYCNVHTKEYPEGVIRGQVA